jgi:hypothetical protein
LLFQDANATNGGTAMRLALLFVLDLVFTAATIWAISVHGYLGFFEAMLGSPATILAILDLTIALGLGLVWMHGDSTERAVPFWPYALLTLTFGVAGPLGYLIHREILARGSVSAGQTATA